MLVSSVTFAPQLSWIEQRARSPRFDQAHSDVREVLVDARAAIERWGLTEELEREGRGGWSERFGS